VQMKLWYLLLGIYILTLSYDTCNDHLCLVSNTVSIDCTHDLECNESPCLCSPFCHCNCSGKPVVTTPVMAQYTPAPIWVNYISRRFDGIYINCLHQVWRPPICSISYFVNVDFYPSVQFATRQIQTGILTS